MKQYLKRDFIIPFFWFCIMQPILFLGSMTLLIWAAIKSIQGTL